MSAFTNSFKIQVPSHLVRQPWCGEIIKMVNWWTATVGRFIDSNFTIILPEPIKEAKEEVIEAVPEEAPVPIEEVKKEELLEAKKDEAPVEEGTFFPSVWN